MFGAAMVKRFGDNGLGENQVEVPVCNSNLSSFCDAMAQLESAPDDRSRRLAPIANRIPRAITLSSIRTGKEIFVRIGPPWIAVLATVSEVLNTGERNDVPSIVGNCKIMENGDTHLTERTVASLRSSSRLRLSSS